MEYMQIHILSKQGRRYNQTSSNQTSSIHMKYMHVEYMYLDI